MYRAVLVGVGYAADLHGGTHQHKQSSYGVPLFFRIVLHGGTHQRKQSSYGVPLFFRIVRIVRIVRVEVVVVYSD